MSRCHDRSLVARWKTEPSRLFGNFDAGIENCFLALTTFALSPIRSGPSIPLPVRIKEQFWHGDVKNRRQHIQVTHPERLHAGKFAADPCLTAFIAMLSEAFSELHLTPAPLF